MTYGFWGEPEEAVGELDEDAVGHDVLHPAHQLQAQLQAREPGGGGAALQARPQQRLLGQDLRGGQPVKGNKDGGPRDPKDRRFET